MARKNVDHGGPAADGSRTKCYSPKSTSLGAIPRGVSSSPTKNYHRQSSVSPRRSSPIARSPPDCSPRSSPSPTLGDGGRYAGCKWTEPPLASSLPPPPQHWMQTSSSSSLFYKLPFKPQPLPFFNEPSSTSCEHITNQLKMLLKVQA